MGDKREEFNQICLCQSLLSLPVHPKGQGLPFYLSKTLGRGPLLLGLSFPMCLMGRRIPKMRPPKVLENEDSWVANSVSSSGSF